MKSLRKARKSVKSLRKVVKSMKIWRNKSFWQFNRRSRLKMDKLGVPFFDFDIRCWVGPSTSQNHGVNFPPPLSFRKIKVFDKIFGKILSPGFWPSKLWFAFFQQWSIGYWLSIPHLKDLDPKILCMCLVLFLLSWVLRFCK